MKNIVGIIVLFSILMAISGCSNDVFNENDIKEFVLEYKTNQYSVEDPSNPPSAEEIGERVKPFLSEEEYESFFVNRYFNLITKVAKNTGKKIELQDVTLEKVEENEDGSFDYNYTLEIKYYDDKSSEIVEKDGQLTIEYNEQYKITRDWEKSTQFEQEAILNKK